MYIHGCSLLNSNFWIVFFLNKKFFKIHISGNKMSDKFFNKEEIWNVEKRKN